MKQRIIRPGEAMALATTAIQRGADGFYFEVAPSAPHNSRMGNVGIVHVRGPLEHHKGDGGDCYEAIIERVCWAFQGIEDGDNDADDQAGPPKAVVLCLDSPGGVVSGLNETVAALQKMRREHGIPLIAYVNEMSASAAYALACSCDEIVCPASAIIGSVGVISTMISQAEQDAARGLDIRLITSGARKADGHLHAPITDDAIDVEAGRVETLAKAFFNIVSKARGLSVSTVRSYQAGIYLGHDAVRHGLADVVLSFDDAVGMLDEDAYGKPAKAGGNETDRRAASKYLDGASKRGSLAAHSGSACAKETHPMSLQLTSARKKLAAAIATEKDPKKVAILTATLEAYKKVEKHIEHTSSEEGDDGDEGEDEDDDKKKPVDDEDDEDSEEDEESEESEESEEKSADEKKMAKGKSKFPMKGDEDEDEEEEEEEEESAKALLALASSATGRKGRAAIGALAAQLAAGQRALKLVDGIQKDRTAEKKAAMVDAALAKRRITRHEARELRGKPMSFVRPFLEMRPKAIIATDDGELHIPSVDARTGDGLGVELEKAISEAMAVAGEGKTADQRAQIRAAMVDAHKAKASTKNGMRY